LFKSYSIDLFLFLFKSFHFSAKEELFSSWPSDLFRTKKKDCL